MRDRVDELTLFHRNVNENSRNGSARIRRAGEAAGHPFDGLVKGREIRIHIPSSLIRDSGKVVPERRQASPVHHPQERLQLLAQRCVCCQVVRTSRERSEQADETLPQRGEVPPPRRPRCIAASIPMPQTVNVVVE